MFPEGAAIVGPVSADMEYVSNEDKARGKATEAADRRSHRAAAVEGDRLRPLGGEGSGQVGHRDNACQGAACAPETAIAGFDFRPAHFEGLTVEPRVMGEKFKYQGWVFRATGDARTERAGQAAQQAVSDCRLLTSQPP